MSLVKGEGATSTGTGKGQGGEGRSKELGLSCVFSPGHLLRMISFLFYLPTHPQTPH